MTVLIGLIASPAGRAGALLALALLALGASSIKGRMEGRAACLAQGERDVLETIRRADRARAAADRRTADERGLRDDDTFRRD